MLSQCPVCNETANPEELIPYRLFRDKVQSPQNIYIFTAFEDPLKIFISSQHLNKDPITKMPATIQGSNCQVDKFRNSTGYTPRPAPIALNLVKNNVEFPPKSQLTCAGEA